MENQAQQIEEMRTPQTLKVTHSIVQGTMFREFWMDFKNQDRVFAHVKEHKNIRVELGFAMGSKTLVTLTLTCLHTALNVNMGYPGCPYKTEEKHQINYFTGDSGPVTYYKWLGKQRNPDMLIDFVLNVLRHAFYKHVDELHVHIEAAPNKFGIYMPILANAVPATVAAEDSDEPDYDNMARQEDDNVHYADQPTAYD